MYPVSQKYLDQINSNNDNQFTFKLNVKRNRTSETLTTLTPDDLEGVNPIVEKQATGNSYFTIGGVCSSKMTMNLTSSGINKLKDAGMFHQNACLEYIEWLKVDDIAQDEDDFSLNADGTENETGKVECGYYYISTIKNSDYSCTIELYDAMLAFNIDVSYRDGINLTQGYRTIHEFLDMICKACTTDIYQLDLADDIDDRISNKDVTYTLGIDSDVESYRTTLGYLSILACGFLVINRAGKLDIIKYDNNNVAELDENAVFEYEMSDTEYEIHYISTSVAGFNYVAEVSPDTDKTFATIFLSENKFLRGIQTADAEELDQKVKDSIDTILEDCKGIKFNGGSITVEHRPELDLGDCISVTKAYVDYTTKALLTKTYENVIICSINSSFGTFDSISCNDYNLDSAYGNKSSSSFKTSSGGGSSKPISTYFAKYLANDLNLEPEAEFQMFNLLILLPSDIGATASIVCVANVTAIGNVEFYIVYDSIELPLKPKYTIHNEGYFTFSFDIGLDPVDGDMQHSLLVYIKSIDTLALETGATDTEIIINASGVQSIQPSWTGRYEITERVRTIHIDNLVNVFGFEESVQKQES